MDRNRPEPLIFTAWLRALNRLIYADELGADFVAFWELRPQFIERVLTRRPEWCDDIATPVAESCAERIERALIEALAELGDAFGSDIGAWRWGDAHYAHFRHGLFGFVPVLRSLADLRIATDGDGFTLNRADSRINSPRNPYADVHGPGLRAVYDLAALDRSLFALAAGQSGNLLSADYGNLLQRWRDGDTFTLPRAPVAVLRLLPLENR